MCPISPAPPLPSHGFPPRINPPPTPVPQNTPRTDLNSFAAPRRNSASVATWTSLPTNTGVPSSAESASPRPNSPSQPGRLRALETLPEAWSTRPGEPMPTPLSAPGCSPAAPDASPIAAARAAATSGGPPCCGVGRRAEPRTLLRASTTTASILVPPRSRPPRAEPFLAAVAIARSSQNGGTPTRVRSGPGLPVVLLLGGRLVDLDPERRQ